MSTHSGEPNSRRRRAELEVRADLGRCPNKGRTRGKRPYILAKLPKQDDREGLCQWLTLSLGLDPKHPITNGRRLGTHDTDGCAVLERGGAPPLWFAPITRLSTPGKLLESLGAGMTSTDGIAPPLTGEHCPAIFAAVRWLCDCDRGDHARERVGADPPNVPDGSAERSKASSRPTAPPVASGTRSPARDSRRPLNQ